MMEVGCLLNFNEKIQEQGILLLYDRLYCLEIGSIGIYTIKPKKMQCFLFEKNIIFSEIHRTETECTNPSYIYVAHFRVSLWRNGYKSVNK